MKRITLLTLALFSAFGVAQAQITASAPVQLSVGIGGAAPDGRSSDAAIPPNGDLVVFSSLATNLVAGDTNNVADIFLADKNNGLTRVSVSSAGGQSDGASEEPAISPLFPDGTFAIAFSSAASNLVPELGPITNQRKQVYLYIPAIQKTILVSRAVTGSDIAGDGDSVHATVTSVQEKEGRRYIVAYSSAASNIAQGGTPSQPGTTNPPARIIFAIIDAADGKILAANSLSGPQGTSANASLLSPVISGRGDTVAFVSAASNLGYENSSSIPQVLICRKSTGDVFELISRGGDGLPGSNLSESPSMSFNGDFVAYQTAAFNILDSSASQKSAALFSAKSGATTRINQNAQGVRNTFGQSHGVMINRNARLGVFIDTSDVFVPGDTNNREDVFVKDLRSGEVVRVSTSATGAQSDGNSRDAVIGGIGYNRPTALVAFNSTASTLATVGDGSNGNVYKVTLTFPPPPFNKESKLESPADVTATSKRLEVVLQEFDDTVSTSSEKAPKAGTVQYDLRVTKVGAAKGLRRNTKTNRVVLRNLAPGKYNVRYRVHGNVDNKKVTTGFSPTITVVVPK